MDCGDHADRPALREGWEDAAPPDKKSPARGAPGSSNDGN